MSKNTRFIAIAGVCLAILVIALAAAITTGGNANSPTDAIKKTLVGSNLTYYSIAGKPMNFTITNADIQGIEKAEFNGRPAWKVHVGPGMAWDLTMDAGGTQILNIKQLFVT